MENSVPISFHWRLLKIKWTYIKRGFFIEEHFAYVKQSIESSKRTLIQNSIAKNAKNKKRKMALALTIIKWREPNKNLLKNLT